MKTFEQEFKDRLENIRARGKAMNMTLSDICKRAKVARATPDRWALRAPLSVRLIDKMADAVSDAEKENQQ